MAWVSPYIHPPFKITATRCDGGSGSEGNRIELEGPYHPRSTRVTLVEVLHKFRSMYIRSIFPGVVFSSKTFPLDKELELLPQYPTIQYFLYFPLFLTFY